MTLTARRTGGLVLTGALAALALLSLLLWDASPYARYLDHSTELSAAGGQATVMGAYLGGWLLMTAAMMLPTTVGLMAAFDRVTRSRPDATRLRLAVIAGFLSVWLLVGFGFRALDVLVHAVVDSFDALSTRPSLVAAGALAVAGAFQFTPLKHRCLTACRTPRSFIMRGWTGHRPLADALRIGAHYGRSCVGCCWALMLVMFGVGTSSLLWMLGLAAVMTAERYTPAPVQRRLGQLTGAALLAASAALLLT